MYNDIASSVMVNGWVSKQFPLSRAIRQGCPVSALLFIVAAEILAERIRTQKQIKGLVFNEEEGGEVKVLQYADDTTLFLRNKKSLEMAWKELGEFEKVAGPSVNKNKIVMKWISGKQHTCCKWDLSAFNLQWDEKHVKYLIGVYIDTDETKIATLNWENKLTKIQRLIDNWRIRNLTFVGRVFIIKSLFISQVVHILMYCANILQMR